jgi:hypothetical protein
MMVDTQQMIQSEGHSSLKHLVPSDHAAEQREEFLMLLCLELKVPDDDIEIESRSPSQEQESSKQGLHEDSPLYHILKGSRTGHI